MTGSQLLRAIANTGTTGVGDELRKLADQWDADRASREAWMASEKAMLARAERAEAVLERMLAVERQLKIASDDPRASYETSRAYEHAANAIAAVLGEHGEARQ